MGGLGSSSAEVWGILEKPAHQAEAERGVGGSGCRWGGLVGSGCGSGASKKGQPDLLWLHTGDEREKSSMNKPFSREQLFQQG